MTTSKIEAQRAYVLQLENALKFYAHEDPANYGNLAALIRTAQDCVYIEQGRLNQMEAAKAAQDAWTRL